MIDIEKLHKTILYKKYYYVDEFLISCYTLVGCIQLNMTKLIIVSITDIQLFKLFLPRLESVFLENDIKIEYIRNDSTLVSYGKQRIKTLVRFVDKNVNISKNKGKHIVINMEI